MKDRFGWACSKGVSRCEVPGPEKTLNKCSSLTRYLLGPYGIRHCAGHKDKDPGSPAVADRMGKQAVRRKEASGKKGMRLCDGVKGPGKWGVTDVQR